MMALGIHAMRLLDSMRAGIRGHLRPLPALQPRPLRNHRRLPPNRAYEGLLLEVLPLLLRRSVADLLAGGYPPLSLLLLLPDRQLNLDLVAVDLIVLVEESLEWRSFLKALQGPDELDHADDVADAASEARADQVGTDGALDVDDLGQLWLVLVLGQLVQGVVVENLQHAVHVLKIATLRVDVHGEPAQALLLLLVRLVPSPGALDASTRPELLVFVLDLLEDALEELGDLFTGVDPAGLRVPLLVLLTLEALPDAQVLRKEHLALLPLAHEVSPDEEVELLAFLRGDLGLGWPLVPRPLAPRIRRFWPVHGVLAIN